MQSFEEFIAENRGKVFRYWEYKKPGISYDFGYGEQKGPYVNEECYYAYIVSCVQLPDGDILLGFDEDPKAENRYIEYRKLSEIELAFASRDQDDGE